MLSLNLGIKWQSKQTLWDDVLRKAALRPGEFKPRAAGIYNRLPATTTTKLPRG